MEAEFNKIDRCCLQNNAFIISYWFYDRNAFLCDFSNGGGQILFSEFVDWALEKNLDLEDDIDEDWTFWLLLPQWLL